MCGSWRRNRVECVMGGLQRVLKTTQEQIQGSRPQKLSRSLRAAQFREGLIKKMGTVLALTDVLQFPEPWISSVSFSCLLSLFTSPAKLMVAHEVNPSPATTLSSLPQCPSGTPSWSRSHLLFPCLHPGCRQQLEKNHTALQTDGRHFTQVASHHSWPPSPPPQPSVCYNFPPSTE